MAEFSRDLAAFGSFIKETTADGSARVRTAFGNLFSGTPGSDDMLTLMSLGISVLFLVIAFRLFLRGRNAPKPSVPLKTQTASLRRAGVAVGFLFFGLFGVWSWYAPLSSAAVAPGVVSPDGSRKTVQHLEGGIIKKILVREGDRVAAGEPLLTLENIRATARYRELRERLAYLLAVESRLKAEQTGEETIDFTFPGDLESEFPDEVALVSTSQEDLFHNRRDTQAARERILAKRVDQLREEIIGLTEVIAAQDQQVALLEQEISIGQELLDQGLQRLGPLLALKRQLAAMFAERAGNRASVARIEQQIGETEIQLYAMRQQTREQGSEELSQIRAELASVRAQIPERADALARTIVRAPIAGMVMNVQVTTELGGVLTPGGEVLDIVPDETDLIIDARVRPQDIDTVFPGMEARVLLTAYAQRNLPQIYGTLRSVSADRLIDERTGEPYFLAKVIVESGQIALLGTDVELISGMPADVMILTGERTVFDFLVKPFADSIRLSFREN